MPQFSGDFYFGGNFFSSFFIALSRYFWFFFSPHVYGLTCCRRHPTPTSAAVSIPLPLLVDGNLIADVEVGLVAIRLGQAFCC